MSDRRPAIDLITCEYPPAVGGVADHTRGLASALTTAGVRVHVWCPADPASASDEGGVTIHALPDRFGPEALRALERGLDGRSSPRRIFVQWVPHGYGRRSLNLPFCAWVLQRARVHGDRVEVMVHEPYLAFDRRHLRQSGAALLHRVMLSMLFAAASAVWLATSSFEPYVRPYGFGRSLGYRCLPVSGLLTATTDDALIARVAAQWPPPVVAHFGTFSPLVTAALAPVIERVLGVRPDATWLLIGRDSERFAQELALRAPHIGHRLVPTGTLGSEALSAHLLAGSLFVQPYPDGVTSRRTTAIALLAHGLPVVTTDGYLTEPFWRRDGGVSLVPAGDADTLACATLDLLRDAAARAQLVGRAKSMYTRRFVTAEALATALQAGD
jgi:glycosyltransferase involved in cell wall biosynthesis